jgi:uncharacterized protein
MYRIVCIILAAFLVAEPAAGGSAAGEQTFAQRLIATGMARINKTVIYDPAYVSIAYPGGDVRQDRGVCTDVLIRAYRGLGIDLQRLVHEDMRRAFKAYPRRWGLHRTDTNIDHRRVPNLRRFFTRHSKPQRVSATGADYAPGDLVTWDLAKPFSGTRVGQPPRNGRLIYASRPHIGIVSDRLSTDGERPLIIHNIGAGTRLDDILFGFQITGRYRFEGKQ